MTQPAQSQSLSSEAAVIGAYTVAEEQLLTDMADAVQHGASRNDLRRIAQRVATRLARTANVRSLLQNAVAKVPGARVSNTDAFQLASRLNVVNQRIVAFADDAYRAAVLDASQRLVAGVGTPASAQHEAWDALTRQGITGYVDRSGRKWNLATYVEMAVRTTAQNAFNDAREQELQRANAEYLTVQHDGHPCPLCRPWEGARLGDGPEAKATVAQARDAGLFHPNCRHVLTVWRPGIAPLTWTTEDERKYRATQQLRYYERQVRSWKRQHAAALDDLSRQRASRKIRAYQGRIRSHVTEHGLNRRSRREQLNLGHH